MVLFYVVGSNYLLSWAVRKQTLYYSRHSCYYYICVAIIAMKTHLQRVHCFLSLQLYPIFAHVM